MTILRRLISWLRRRSISRRTKFPSMWIWPGSILETPVFSGSAAITKGDVLYFTQTDGTKQAVGYALSDAEVGQSVMIVMYGGEAEIVS